MDELQRQGFRSKIFQAHHESTAVKLTVDEAFAVSDSLDAALKRAEQAEAALAAMKTPCAWRWKMDDSEQHWSHWWYADCGHQQEDRPPAEWDFCPYCSHPIEVQG